MKIKVFIMSLIFAVFGAAALAQSLSVAVGQEGRGYESRGMAIAEQLRDGWGVKNFAGSEDIARAVCNDPETPIGIAQIDAVRAMEIEGCKLRQIGIYPSLEYAFVLFPPGGDNELDDLDSDSRILVDEVGSGTALFWQTIVNIEAEHGNGSSWADAQPVYDNMIFAEGMADAGEIDAVLMVGNPNSQEVWDLLSAGWDAGELDDKDINDLQFRKGPLYTRENVKIDPPGVFNGDSENAFVVRSYFIVNTDNLDRGTMKRLARIVKALK